MEEWSRARHFVFRCLSQNANNSPAANELALHFSAARSTSRVPVVCARICTSVYTSKSHRQSLRGVRSHYHSPFDNSIEIDQSVTRSSGGGSLASSVVVRERRTRPSPLSPGRHAVAVDFRVQKSKHKMRFMFRTDAPSHISCRQRRTFAMHRAQVACNFGWSFNDTPLSSSFRPMA